jgi:hypothetical protein
MQRRIEGLVKTHLGTIQLLHRLSRSLRAADNCTADTEQDDRRSAQRRGRANLRKAFGIRKRRTYLGVHRRRPIREIVASSGRRLPANPSARSQPKLAGSRWGRFRRCGKRKQSRGHRSRPPSAKPYGSGWTAPRVRACAAPDTGDNASLRWSSHRRARSARCDIAFSKTCSYSSAVRSSCAMARPVTTRKKTLHMRVPTFAASPAISSIW